MKVDSIKISEIKPYGKNAKKHPQAQIEQIANSIKEFGFLQPVVVDKNNNLIVGHGRVEAAKLLGLEEVPTVLASDLTKEQVKAYRLADNKLNESDWDMAFVLEELNDLSKDLVSLTGFDIGKLPISFEPIDDDLIRLDKKKEVECPNCHEVFET